MKKNILFTVPLLCLTGCGTPQTSLPSNTNDTNFEIKDSEYYSLSSKEEERAAELFKICIPCHGNKAQLHALDVSSIIAEWNFDTIKEALFSYQNGTRNITGNGYIMQGEMRLIDEKDIELLARYIPTLLTNK